jgi:hypothetical protein
MKKLKYIHAMRIQIHPKPLPQYLQMTLTAAVTVLIGKSTELIDPSLF